MYVACSLYIVYYFNQQCTIYIFYFNNIYIITLVNKGFVPLGKMSVSDVFLDAEFKYVSRISLSPTPFAPG